MTRTHALKPSRIIVAALTVAIALVSTMAFLTTIRTQAAPLLGTGNDPEIRFITMAADIPHYDPESNDGINKTVYFSNSVNGVITMTFDISGTQTLTLTAGAAFDEQERVYTSTTQTWIQPITYSVVDTHTTQPNIIYTAARDDGFTTTVAITYVRDVTAPVMSPLISPISGTITSTCAVNFDWSDADDGTGSGVAGYNFKLNGTVYTTTNSYTQTTCLANGAYTWTVRAYDGIGNYGNYATARTLRIGYFYVYLPLTLRNHAPFNNGSFEAGLAGWQEAESPLSVSVVSSIQERPSGSTSPADGDNAILLGNTSYQCNSVPIGYAAVEQTFSVPQDASNLTFKYIIWSQDASTSEKYDRFEVYINNSLVFSDGNQVNTGLACDKWRRVPGTENLRDEATSGWATATISLNSYKGQSITLSFRNYSRYDNYYNTYTYIDDVRIEE